ncbi:MAG: cadmium-translocating P-type ATPase [Burkholderiales bacterium]|nr:cadmium-translocating P-type ATPase [Burkholderiales bacterium]
MSGAHAQACFHCGEPVPGGSRQHAVIDGVARAMCCAGCAAVARTIAAHGLAAYYANRSALAPRETAAPAQDAEFTAYDLAAVQQPFVRDAGGGVRQATLLVEGLTCGACAWLIERGVARVEGVREVAVNAAARRMQVEWDFARVKLSDILRALAALGYRSRGFDPAARERAAARERRVMLWRIFVAAFAMMQVMMYALPGYVSEGEMTPGAERLMRWASLVLTMPVMLWSAAPFFGNAWRDLRAHRVGMDVPVALALAVAFAASARATAIGHGAVYFDSITMFVFLLLGARYLEAKARSIAAESQRRLVGHVPAVADRAVPGAAPGTTERVAAAALVPGDRVVVAPGGIIPADGVVEAGWSAADESLLTGESRPVPKAPGDAVTGGSINLSNPVTLEVTRVGADTVLSGIVRLMDRAQSEKPAIARCADRVAQWFVAALIGVAAATALAWYFIDPQRALEVTVAVLVVSCPCALSLATPAALAAATGALHRAGILVTRAHALETLARATHVVFDKTGTLTRGSLALIGIVPLGAHSREACLALAAALEHGASHPVARAILAVAGAEGIAVPAAEATEHAPGLGIEGRVGDRRMRIGTPAFAAALAGAPAPGELRLVVDEATVAVLADEQGLVALFTFGDAPRPGARWIVRELERRGAAVCLLSGDRGAVAARLARELGIATAAGDATPRAKLEFVRGLQSRGGVVAMVGDGVNDAPVLARAEVSIAMGGGADLAHAGADMILMGEDVGRLADAFDISSSAMRVIRQNLAWAAGYNAVAVPLAVAGLVTPLAAGIGMAASSLAVVLNALRLQPPAPPPRDEASILPPMDADERRFPPRRGTISPA